MKIIHLIHGLNTGGAETLVKNYMLNFDDKKNDVILLCMNHEEESPYEKELADEGKKVIYVEDRLPFGGSKSLIAKVIAKPLRYFVIRRIIRKESPDIIHTHLPINGYIKFARPKRGTVIFHTVHSDPAKLWSGSGKKDATTLRWLMRHYQIHFIVLHEGMKKEVDKMFGVTNTLVLNNGINTKRFKELGGKENTKVELGIPKDAYVVGHVGRFSDVKNHDFLIDVFIEFARKKKNAFLLMVGDGFKREGIINKLNENGFEKKFLILSNRSDLPEILNLMDVFVFPSKYEGLGVALVEAQEAKLPCFVSDAVPEHATISNLVTRLPLGDGANAWAEKVLAYKYPKKITIDDAEWDIKKIVKKLELIYEDSLGAKNGK